MANNFCLGRKESFQSIDQKAKCDIEAIRELLIEGMEETRCHQGSDSVKIMTMGKYFITGRQGSGKTTVIKLLQERGFTAYNTDELPEATKLQNRVTGEVVVWPKGEGVDWSKFAWNWQKLEVEKLLASAKNVFLGAVVSNQVDFYPLLDKVFVLTVDPNTLRQRLEVHEHESHHVPGEVARILTDHDKKQQLFIDEGAEPIAANRPANEIVDEILERVGLK